MGKSCTKHTKETPPFSHTPYLNQKQAQKYNNFIKPPRNPPPKISPRISSRNQRVARGGKGRGPNRLLVKQWSCAGVNYTASANVTSQQPNTQPPPSPLQTKTETNPRSLTFATNGLRPYPKQNGGSTPKPPPNQIRKNEC